MHNALKFSFLIWCRPFWPGAAAGPAASGVASDDSDDEAEGGGGASGGGLGGRLKKSLSTPSFRSFLETNVSMMLLSPTAAAATGHRRLPAYQENEEDECSSSSSDEFNHHWINSLETVYVLRCSACAVKFIQVLLLVLIFCTLAGCAVCLNMS